MEKKNFYGEVKHLHKTVVAENRDKKVFLLDDEVYTAYEANDFTEDDLESLVSEETYTENFTIIKIDANDYNSFEEAIKGEGLSKNGYYIRVFGF